jgi:hypothetical protein
MRTIEEIKVDLAKPCDYEDYMEKWLAYRYKPEEM